jgi:hypothetical protein
MSDVLRDVRRCEQREGALQPVFLMEEQMNEVVQGLRYMHQSNLLDK